jgi:hypothetical protein
MRFLRALYCVDGSLRPLRGDAATVRGCPADAAGSRAFPRAHPILFDAGGMSLHPYPQGSLPPGEVTPFEPDYADLAALPTVERTLDRILSAYGASTGLPIYSTEFGYQTDPPEKLTTAVSPALAAAYLNQAEYLSWRDPRLRSYDQYQLLDPPGAGALGGFATGLRFASGVAKATYAAFRLPLFLPVTRTSSGHPLEVWGCARPWHYFSVGGARMVAIQWRSSPASAWRAVRTVRLTNVHGYFDVPVSFPASGQVRLRWAYPQGPVILSRTVSISIR